MRRTQLGHATSAALQRLGRRRLAVSLPAVAVLITPLVIALVVETDGRSRSSHNWRCPTPSHASCILAVYRGGPLLYRSVEEIPLRALVTRRSDGRYHVQRGRQYTVITAATPPDGYTRFSLRQRRPKGTISATSAMQLVQPAGTTFTFTVNSDERGASLMTFDLYVAREPPVHRASQRPEPGEVVVTVEFIMPTLTYNRLDTTGAADSPGSYAFLQTAGDLSTAIENFGNWPALGVELRIHSNDASGVSRAAFYDIIRVGDEFDYRSNGLDCGFRHQVTSIGKDSTIRVFGLRYIHGFGRYCPDFQKNPSAATDVAFVWRVTGGFPAADGVPVMFFGEIVDAGTYRLSKRFPCVIDVPQAGRISFDGVFYQTPYVDDPPDTSPYGAMLLDVPSGSLLTLDPESGVETSRSSYSSEADSLFDDIAASVRCDE